MSKYDVTFETKCYEKDWEILLKTNRLEKAIKNCNYDFKEKIIYINNVSDMEQASFYAEKLVEKKVITKYVKVQDFAEEALKFFDINREEFKGGYYYSIQEFVGIYLCKTPYLLHFSSDAMIKRPFKWIEEAITVMEMNENIVVANPTWNNKFYEAQSESIEEMKDFYLGQGFSDQCYLVPVKKFRAPIFNENNQHSERYPKYGGELFEKRVDAWMRNNGFMRITSKMGSYAHRNHPKNNMIRKLYVALNSNA